MDVPADLISCIFLSSDIRFHLSALLYLSGGEMSQASWQRGKSSARIRGLFSPRLDQSSLSARKQQPERLALAGGSYPGDIGAAPENPQSISMRPQKRSSLSPFFVRDFGKAPNG